MEQDGTATGIRGALSIILIGGLVFGAILALRGGPAPGGQIPASSAAATQQIGPSAGPGDPAKTPAADTPAPWTSSPGPTPVPSPAGFATVNIESGGTLSVTPGAIATLKPGYFGANRGHPRVQRQTLPAPWTGGSLSTVEVVVRLPANYDPVHTRYPTVYETPMPYEAWSSVLRPHSALDVAEQAGDIPPMIYVFAGAIGGPHPVTQCIDSADGLQHWDTFMSTTLVAWVDSHYATIADPAARTIMGSSQGGYCAADLMLRHPDVWHQEISFDGFYDAPPRNPWTAGGGQVFGGNQALMDAYSPITIAPQLPTGARQSLFAVLLGLPSQAFYGPQYALFGGVLDQNGYARAMIDTPYGHSWGTVDAFMARSLRLVAARMVEQGTVP